MMERKEGEGEGGHGEYEEIGDAASYERTKRHWVQVMEGGKLLVCKCAMMLEMTL